ncbi:hypothetical protein [Mammaliicoccus lentus]|uniref:hypothetical protein n=1 Tax=Mammaliicoccus lentus TaxID=42858 RepID=UPI00374E2639
MDKNVQNNLLSHMYEMDIMVSELIQLGMNMNDNKNEIQNKLIEINQCTNSLLVDPFGIEIKNESIEIEED